MYTNTHIYYYEYLALNVVILRTLAASKMDFYLDQIKIHLRCVKQ